jgi:O-succinylbenzoic acid--CoA ligase
MGYRVSTLYLQQRLDQSWLIGCDSSQFNLLVEEKSEQIANIANQEKPLNIFICDRDPDRFLAYFLAAISTNNHIFLCNPDWKQSEWKQVCDLVQPNLILGKEYRITNNQQQITNNQQQIMIPTGGSSGKIRFAIHTWETLTASVGGFQQYFALESVNSFCVLPLYHVSGLMQFMRSFVTGGQLVVLPYKSLKEGKKFELINPQDFFISLVPTQLQFLLQTEPNWLASFKTVLLGGAPAWRSLLEDARKYRIPLAPTYGMTETASQVATLKPEDFLAGNNSSGRVLPHAAIEIIKRIPPSPPYSREENSLEVPLIKGDLGGSNETNKTSQTIPNNKDTNNGIITIKSASLCLGYYPNLFGDRESFLTDDLGYIDKAGYLYIVARNSQKIITGGENVFPSEVEATILATNLVSDVCVVGIPDLQWGQIVVAVYVSEQEDLSLIKAKLEPQLSKYKQPKHWIKVAKLPRNKQGKLNYQKILTITKQSFEQC